MNRNIFDEKRKKYLKHIKVDPTPFHIQQLRPWQCLVSMVSSSYAPQTAGSSPFRSGVTVQSCAVRKAGLDCSLWSPFVPAICLWESGLEKGAHEGRHLGSLRTRNAHEQ